MRSPRSRSLLVHVSYVKQRRHTAAMYEPYLAVFRDGMRHKIFLPELVPKVASHFQSWTLDEVEDVLYKSERKRQLSRTILTKRCTTLLACCLVCRDWHRSFLPQLYRCVFFWDSKMCSFILRTLWHIKPEYQQLIHVIMIDNHLLTSGWVPILLCLPNIGSLYISGFDISRFPTQLPQLCSLRGSIRHVILSIKSTPDESLKPLLRLIRRTKLRYVSVSYGCLEGGAGPALDSYGM